MQQNGQPELLWQLQVVPAKRTQSGGGKKIDVMNFLKCENLKFRFLHYLQFQLWNDMTLRRNDDKIKKQNY